MNDFYGRWAWLGFAVFAGAILWLGYSPLGAGIKTGSSLGDVRGEMTDGSTFELEALRGKVVVLNFWATWCGPCRAEGKVLNRLHGEGVEVIGLATDRLPLQTIGDKARALRFSYPVGKPAPGVLQRLGISSVPTTIVIDPKGAVTFAASGVVSEETFREAIADAAR